MKLRKNVKFSLWLNSDLFLHVHSFSIVSKGEGKSLFAKWDSVFCFKATSMQQEAFLGFRVLVQAVVTDDHDWQVSRQSTIPTSNLPVTSAFFSELEVDLPIRVTLMPFSSPTPIFQLPLSISDSVPPPLLCSSSSALAPFATSFPSWFPLSRAIAQLQLAVTNDRARIGFQSGFVTAICSWPVDLLAPFSSRGVSAIVASHSFPEHLLLSLWFCYPEALVHPDLLSLYACSSCWVWIFKLYSHCYCNNQSACVA